MFLSLAKTSSDYAPYIDCLPTKFNTPVNFTKKQLSFLRGTALGFATAQQKQKIQKKWSDLCKHSPEFKRRVDLETYMWADSIYWSRVLGMPSLNSGGDEQAETNAIVPLIDFCNHSHKPTAFWEVIDSDEGDRLALKLVAGEDDLSKGDEVTISYGTTPSFVVHLQVFSGSHEIWTLAGDKSDEELLFL
jgi:hypothetical protein